MKLQDMRTLFRQLGPVRGLGQLAREAWRHRLDRGTAASYAQFAEDLILARLLDGRREGFYVDAGSNHPRRFSNTWRFYLKGWRGITVDANPDMVALHRAWRPRDIAVEAALSDAEREAVFTTFDDALVSSLDPAHVRAWGARRRVVAERRVRTRRLDSVLAECGAPRRFDLLSVDVERHDLEVLRSLDLQAWRPEVIVVEMHGFRPDAPREDPVWRHLDGQGYRLVGFALVNGYFRDAQAEPPAG